MCLQDLRLGRQRYGDPVLTAVAATDTVVAPANPRRVAIAFGKDGTLGSASVAPYPMNSPLDGFRCSSVNALMLVFDIETFGRGIQREWHGIGSVAGNIVVWDIQTQDE